MKNISIPADIARQTLIQLANKSLPPTPDNYAAVYNSIAGHKAPSVHQSLQKTLLKASKSNPRYKESGKVILSAVEKQNWTKLEAELETLLSQQGQNASTDVNWATLIRTLLKQLETGHKGITLTRKKEGLSKVLINFAKDPIALAEKIQSLMRSWGTETSSLETKEHAILGTHNQASATVSSNTDAKTKNATLHDQSTSQLSEMMIRTLDLALIPLLKDTPKSHKNAQNLSAELKKNTSNRTLTKCAHDLKSVLFSVEADMEEKQSINQALVDLLSMLAKSMGELVAEDQWLSGQMDIVNDVLSKPITALTLQNAESSLKELIHKQSNLKPALNDAQDLLTQMAATFISRLVDITESTDDYHQKIEGHQEKLSSVNGIDELNGVLKNVLEDTRTIGLTVQRTREEFSDSQTKVNEAEQKIQELTSVLEYINEVANEDYLTGTLNRRGMEEALEREFSRADRHQTELSIAMMDIDHFKKLNDKLGHSTGDQALAHFANVIKSVKRATDVLARYGGEEFIIILPNTEQNDAIKVIERVQRKLTKQFFMHSNQHVVITFSAGVAQRVENETPEDIIPRADAALYEAKNSGRNRVLGAPIIESDQIEPKAIASKPDTTEETRH